MLVNVLQIMNLRVLFLSPSQELAFALAQSDIAFATQRNSAKEQLFPTIQELHEQDISYREIGQAVGLHWTRIQQIVKKIVEMPRI